MNNLYLIAGQSNADGRATGFIAPYAAPTYAARYWFDDKWWPLQPRVWNSAPVPENKGGPECTLGRALGAVDALSGDDTYLVKYAVSGSPIADWLAGAPAGYLDGLVARLALAQASLGESSVKALFWAQGEQDAVLQVTADAYQANLTQFISDIRTALSLPNLVVVLGGVPSGAWVGLATVRAAQAAVAAADSYVELTTTEDAVLFDGTHLDAASQAVAGVRLAQAYQQVVVLLAAFSQVNTGGLGVSRTGHKILGS
jgi:hypothetical protein